MLLMTHFEMTDRRRRRRRRRRPKVVPKGAADFVRQLKIYLTATLETKYCDLTEKNPFSLS